MAGPCVSCSFPMTRFDDREYEAGDTPLINTAFLGHIECMRAWLRAGVDVNEFNGNDETALYHAAKMDQDRAAYELIQAGADVNFSNVKGSTPLIAAAMAGSDTCVRVFLQAGADVNFANERNVTPLIAAAMSGSDACVKVLVEAGADVNMRSIKRKTALVAAAQNGMRESVSLLIKAGANVNVAQRDGSTAFFFAVRNEDYECLALLLKSGAQINRRNITSLNTLDLCMMPSCGQIRIQIDKNILLLLYAAGETPRYNRDKLLKLLGFEEEKNQLKHMCREAVRKHLINLDLHSHLFDRVPKLPLPSLLHEYLLYDVSLEA